MCGYKKDMQKSFDNLSRLNSQVFSSKYGDIEFLVKGEGPTVLISHGNGGGIDQGDLLAGNFFNSDYKILLISRFGYLKSSIPDNPSATLQADAYKDLLDHLEIEKVYLFATSAGSTSAIQFALRYPQSCTGLILHSANAPLGFNPGTPPKFIFKSNFLYWLFLKLFGKIMITMFVPKSILKNMPKNELNTLMDEVFFSVLPVTERTQGMLFDTLISNPSINKSIPFEEVRVPTIIFNSIDDPATVIEGARTLDRKIPNSKLNEFKTGGHLTIGRDEEIKQKIDFFIHNEL